MVYFLHLSNVVLVWLIPLGVVLGARQPSGPVELFTQMAF